MCKIAILEDNDEALRITKKAFHYIDEGDLKGAIYELLKIYGVGIASASKGIGIFDPNSLAIYDSAREQKNDSFLVVEYLMLTFVHLCMKKPIS